MSSAAADSTATPELDHAEHLPPQNQRSYVAMLAVQALNAFNDNFVKILLVTFAGVVAKGTDLGGSMQLYLGAIFALPYIVFAPVAGWLSDRFSKQRVIFWMQVIQVIIFALFLGALSLDDTQMTLWASLGCFFLLAAQAAFFSPAKYGILKELVGSRRMGQASGTLQLTNFVGILAGMGLAGAWFAHGIKEAAKPAEALELFRPFASLSPLIHAAWEPLHAQAKAHLDSASWAIVHWLLIAVTIVAGAQIVGALFIHRTPEHDKVRFHRGVWLEHFTHLKLLLSQRPLMLAALGVTFFWFMSNAVGSILVTLAHEMHPTDAEASAHAISMMPAMLGVGIMLGSVLAGIVCRKRIELGLVPLSGYLLAASLFASGLAPVSPWIYASLICVGLAAGAFMTPLYAFVQDQAKPEERARILSAMNLIDCVGGIVANLVLVKGMLIFKVPSYIQLLVMVPITLGAAVFITKLLPRPLVMLVANMILRMLYRIHVHYPERMPAQGPLLVLPNHVSYADALVLGVSTDRKVRFVMLDSLYKMKSIQWFLKLFGTVPISATKAKEAIRTVGEALAQGEAAVLFPEGQLTRTGFLNEVNKGYQLMARMGGTVAVQPVWLDGLWGSIFSYEGGRFFRKVPRAFPYRVGVWFGKPMTSLEATPARVREVMWALCSEAFLSRPLTRKTPALVQADGRLVDTAEARTAHVNALRVLETSLLRQGDVVLCLLNPDHVLGQTFGLALSELRGITTCWTVDELLQDEKNGAMEGHRIIAVGNATGLTDPRLHSAARPNILTVQVISNSSSLSAAAASAGSTCPAVYDEATGVLLTLSVPDPTLPEKEQGAQVGHKPGSLGHVLPGLAITVPTTGGSLEFAGLLPDSGATAQLHGVRLDDDGFILPLVTTIAA